MRPLQRLLRRRFGRLPTLRLQIEGFANGRQSGDSPKAPGRLVRRQKWLVQNLRQDTGSWSADLADITARAQQKCFIKDIARGGAIFLEFLMSEFPVKLRWSRFLSVLRKLGYNPARSSRGSKRVFFNPTRTPTRIMFPEPHPGDTLHTTTLHDSLRRLGLSPDEFVRLLE